MLVECVKTIFIAYWSKVVILNEKSNRGRRTKQTPHGRPTRRAVVRNRRSFSRALAAAPYAAPNQAGRQRAKCQVGAGAGRLAAVAGERFSIAIQ
jgi:hypothetical protein